MPAKLALLLCIALIAWFFARERKSHKPVSVALWIPLIWAFIIGSKPVSEWLGSGVSSANAADNFEGSPLDRLILFSLIAAGLLVLFQRRESWASILLNNKWVFAFYLYLGLSVLWSDYSFISFKRWIKDLGNVIMALIVLSEEDPLQAIKIVLLRSVYFLVPLSVLVIKYFPDIGRYYDRWSYGVYYCGITGDKNLLGMTLFVCSLFIFQLLLDSGKAKMPGENLLPRAALLLLLLMAIWLLRIAHSATAMVCTIVSGGILFLLHRFGPQKLMVIGLLVAVLAVMALPFLDAGGLLKGIIGRDTTLTGRTEIWRMLLSEKVNPLIGVGFYSFWLGERSNKLSEKYHYSLNEAHNGYLELYLNSGLIGVFLLLSIFGSSLHAQWQQLQNGVSGAGFRISFIVGTILYNISEATFNRLSIIWLTFIIIVVVYPRSHEEFSAADSPILSEARGARGYRG